MDLLSVLGTRKVARWFEWAQQPRSYAPHYCRIPFWGERNGHALLRGQQDNRRRGLQQ
jgi:hypothetical protein